MSKRDSICFKLLISAFFLTLSIGCGDKNSHSSTSNQGSSGLIVGTADPGPTLPPILVTIPGWVCDSSSGLPLEIINAYLAGGRCADDPGLAYWQGIISADLANKATYLQTITAQVSAETQAARDSRCSSAQYRFFKNNLCAIREFEIPDWFCAGTYLSSEIINAYLAGGRCADTGGLDFWLQKILDAPAEKSLHLDSISLAVGNETSANRDAECKARVPSSVGSRYHFTTMRNCVFN